MKSAVFATLIFMGSLAQASESWVCMCYADAAQRSEVGGVALEPTLSLEQAEAEALNTCKNFEPSTVSVRCEKYNDGEE